MKKIIIIIAMLCMTTYSYADEKSDNQWLKENKERINKHCSKSWDGDYEMMAYCTEQQLNALIELSKYINNPDINDDKITIKCSTDWGYPNDMDFEMINYCVKQQLKGKEKLNRFNDL